MKDRIKNIMTEKKLTSFNFATLIGIHPSAVSHILSGRNNPSGDVLQKILRKIPEINPEWLMLGEGAMYRKDIEQAKTQYIKYQNELNKSQIKPLFPNELEEDTKYRKDNNLNTGGNSQQSKPISPNQSASEINRQMEEFSVNDKNSEIKIQTETKTISSKKIVKNIILYFDNTYEEYDMKLKNED